MLLPPASVAQHNERILIIKVIVIEFGFILLKKSQSCVNVGNNIDLRKTIHLDSLIVFDPPLKWQVYNKYMKYYPLVAWN